MARIASRPAKVSTPVAGFVPKRDLWVQLRNAPSDYAYDQAVLVCELNADEWIALGAGHGELVLNRSQFHRIGAAA